jgi:glycogen phosphorylase
MEYQGSETFSHVPERISGLVDLSYNLWWSWHPEPRRLFRQLSQLAWREYVENPVAMLQAIPRYYLEKAAENPDYLHRYDIVMHRFRRYMGRKSSWFTDQYPDREMLTIAYFSAEYGLHHSLPFYSGGLGFLAGDHLKECSDLGVSMVAVGFMYAQGFLHQHIRSDGWQENICQPIVRDRAPISRELDQEGKQLVVRVPYFDPPLYVAVWRVDVGRVPLYLLDTDIEQNDPRDRPISSRLYTGDSEMRLRQEIVLGIGGRKVLQVLGVEYYAVHLNEGHPAFALLERIRERVEGGMSFKQALEQVRGTSVFTTHTPVPAGHDIFPVSLMDKYFSEYYPRLGIDRETFLSLGAHPHRPQDGFSMSALALRATAYHNAVSQKHGEVARTMWRWLWPDLPEDKIPIDAITNGVHLQTWLDPMMGDLFNKYIFPVYPHWQQDHDDPIVWQLLDDIPPRELWEVHSWLKERMINRIREMKRKDWEEERDEPVNLAAGGLMLNPNILTLGFARRFASYKRSDLIFHDPDRLKSILNNPLGPVQVVFAGKAHPSDEDGKRILQRVYHYAEQPEFAGRIAFVEDYGEQVAQWLVHGVDVWLNNPVPPMEASGTSGMKAAMNGALNLSILDGWWAEGYNGRNGWAFGDHVPEGDRDAADAHAIYDLLENEVVPLYYSRDLEGIPRVWVQMMKDSIKSAASRFSARRMVKEYVSRYYPSLLRCAEACRIDTSRRGDGGAGE